MTDQHVYSPEVIIKAYSLGLFPMADSRNSLDIKFYDPEQRALIPIDNTLGRGVHIPRRLQRRVRQAPYEVTINQDFTAVIDACATLNDQREDTWINPEIRRLYIALHKMGFAHSVEVWLDGALVGGLYGVALRAAFFGESCLQEKAMRQKSPLSISWLGCGMAGFCCLMPNLPMNICNNLVLPKLTEKTFRTASGCTFHRGSFSLEHRAQS